MAGFDSWVAVALLLLVVVVVVLLLLGAARCGRCGALRSPGALAGLPGSTTCMAERMEGPIRSDVSIHDMYCFWQLTHDS